MPIIEQPNSSSFVCCFFSFLIFFGFGSVHWLSYFFLWFKSKSCLFFGQSGKYWEHWNNFKCLEATTLIWPLLAKNLLFNNCFVRENKKDKSEKDPRPKFYHKTSQAKCCFRKFYFDFHISFIFFCNWEVVFWEKSIFFGVNKNKREERNNIPSRPRINKQQNA